MEKEISKEQAKELLDFIEKKWDDLICDARDKSKAARGADDILYLPYDYVVPGKEKFDAMFYWDSFFIIRGLKTEMRRESLVKGIVDNCLYEIETYGKVLNANKKKWSTRSQLPYLALMVKDVYENSRDKKWLKKSFDLLKKEYNEYWMDKYHLTPAGLSRFYDESGNEPIGNYKRAHAYKSRAEASWDMSPRFSNEDIHDLLPIDLNCNLYQYERQFAKFALGLGDGEEARKWDKKSEKRKQIINKLMWDRTDGLFYDYDFKKGEKKKIRSLAGYQGMFAGLADKNQAKALKDNLKIFETKGGLAACGKENEFPDCQWDWPTVWAPLQYICHEGMKNYGYLREAEKINKDFVKLVYENWKETGKIWEKYNGITGDLAKISERYPSQSGFGWTNAVTEVFIKEIYKI